MHRTRIERATSRVAGTTVAIKPLHHWLIIRPAVIVKSMLRWARHFVKLHLFPWTSVWLLPLVSIATLFRDRVRHSRVHSCPRLPHHGIGPSVSLVTDTHHDGKVGMGRRDECRRHRRCAQSATRIDSNFWSIENRKLPTTFQISN